MPRFTIMMPDGKKVDITDKIKKSKDEDDVKAAVIDALKPALKKKKS